MSDYGHVRDIGLQKANDLLRLIEAHKFHNPLSPTACDLGRVEEFRAANTPTASWGRAVSNALRPPMPVAVILGVIAVETVAIALLLYAVGDLLA